MLSNHTLAETGNQILDRVGQINLRSELFVATPKKLLLEGLFGIAIYSLTKFALHDSIGSLLNM